MGRRRTSIAAFVGVGLLVSVLLVVVLAPRASSSPDGLEKVAADTGIDAGARPPATADGPLADYGVRGVDDPALGTVLAGTIGVAVTFVLMAAIVWLVRRRRPPPEPAAG